MIIVYAASGRTRCMDAQLGHSAVKLHSVRWWVETVGWEVGWSNLVEMVYAVWFNLILEDSGVGWFGVL